MDRQLVVSDRFRQNLRLAGLRHERRGPDDLQHQWVIPGWLAQVLCPVESQRRGHPERKPVGIHWRCGRRGFGEREEHGGCEPADVADDEFPDGLARGQRQFLLAR